MSENTPTPVDQNQLIRAHQANYAVFEARTEKEANEAICNALKDSQYVCLYYTVSDHGLERMLAYDPTLHTELRYAAEEVVITQA